MRILPTLFFLQGCAFFPLAVFYGIQHFCLNPFLLRCLLEEKDVLSLEKGFDMKELKEEVVSLSGLFRQLRLQKAELDQGNKSQVSVLQHCFLNGSIVVIKH